MRKDATTTLMIVAAIVTGIWLWTKRESTAEALVKAATTPPTPAETSGVSKMLWEKPPSDVALITIGQVTYAKFDTPIDVGSGFKQWGVDVYGNPVVAMNEPSSYVYGFEM